MQIPSWTQPALTGAAVGAVVVALSGFSYGGWVTGGTAAGMATSAAREARTQLAASICAHNFAAAPDASAQLIKLKEMKSWNRDEFITEGGWAIISGLDDNVRGTADACAKQLAAMD